MCKRRRGARSCPAGGGGRRPAHRGGRPTRCRRRHPGAPPCRSFVPRATRRPGRAPPAAARGRTAGAGARSTACAGRRRPARPSPSRPRRPEIRWSRSRSGPAPCPGPAAGRSEWTRRIPRRGHGAEPGVRWFARVVCAVGRGLRGGSPRGEEPDDTKDENPHGCRAFARRRPASAPSGLPTIHAVGSPPATVIEPTVAHW
jgi:hypothetical protein